MKPELKKLVFFLSCILVIFSFLELIRLAKNQNNELFVLGLMIPTFTVIYLYFFSVRERLDEYKKNSAAIKTLKRLNYTYYGGEEWKPPIGKPPDFNLIDSLNARIIELESQSHTHIDEIKAQGIDEAVAFANENMEKHDGAIEYRIDILDYADQLRTKHG